MGKPTICLLVFPRGGSNVISDALLHGLVSRVVPHDNLEEEVGIMGIKQEIT